MPDLSGTKSTSKTIVAERKPSIQTSDRSSNSRHQDKRAGPKISHSPPRRRPRRSRSSSSSTSSSESSGSNSNGSSASSLSIPKVVPKKTQISASSTKITTTSSTTRTQSTILSNEAHTRPNDITVPVQNKSNDASDSKTYRDKPNDASDSKPHRDKLNDISDPKTHRDKLNDASDSKAHRELKKTSSALSSNTKEAGTARSESIPKPLTSQASSQPEEATKVIAQSTDSKQTTHISPDKTANQIMKSNVEQTTEKVPSTMSNAQPDHDSFTRILVEKLTKNVTKAHMHEIFSVWGKIESVELPPDRIHPEFNRGYGYVEYVDPKSASDALNFMNGGQIDGQVVRITEIIQRPLSHAHDSKSHDHRTSQHRQRERDVRKSSPERIRKQDEHISDRRRGRDRVAERDDLDRRRHDRLRDRIHAQDQNREREKPRDKDPIRDRQRPGRNDEPDRGWRTRRGSSGSPFASRSGHPTDRPRSPLSGSRYRRPSPPASRARRPRSRSPLVKPTSTSTRNVADDKPALTATRRARKDSSRSSSSSSSSNSASSASSSSSSGSGSSSTSSSSSSRSRS